MISDENLKQLREMIAELLDEKLKAWGLEKRLSAAALRMRRMREQKRNAETNKSVTDKGQRRNKGVTPEVEKRNAPINGSKYYSDAEDVLSYLNRTTGKGYEFRNRSGELTASADRIVARLKQGYTREELREVVHAKAEQWLHDDRMAEYLRPMTLFSKEKFEQYLGELKGG